MQLRFRLLLLSLVALLFVSLGARDSTSHPPDLSVCHVPPAAKKQKPARPHAVRVGSEASLQAHLRHGDTVFGLGLASDCTGGRTVTIDPELEPGQGSLPGRGGAPARPIAAYVGLQGIRRDFVLNELSFKPASPADLASLLARYGGDVLRDDTLLIAERDQLRELPGGNDGWHLIQIDPGTSGLADLLDLLTNAGIEGSVVVSSLDAARNLALELREGDRKLSLNYVVSEVRSQILEHPTSDGGNLDFNEPDLSAFVPISAPMTDDDDPDEPGDQGFSMSVVRAWDYLRHTGLPPLNGVFTPTRIAIIDGGFDLDPSTGAGNPDYYDGPFSTPLQLDLIGGDLRAGGPNEPSIEDPVLNWHGQASFGACCAFPRNGFGSAGAGGGLVRASPIRTDKTLDGIAEAIRAATHMEVAIATISLVYHCIEPGCARESENIQGAVDAAVEAGMAVFAGAGNDGFDLGDRASGFRLLPCQLEDVTCVGGVYPPRLTNPELGYNAYNFGESFVDIFGPWMVRSTVAPGPAAEDEDDFDEDELLFYAGTSAATPFVAGIAGLLKAADRTLTPREIESVLQSTANCVLDEPTSPCPHLELDFLDPDPRVQTGYPDALRAVRAVRPNPPPVVNILAPVDGTITTWTLVPFLTAHVADDPAPGGFRGTLSFVSDRDGELCRVERAFEPGEPEPPSALSCAPDFGSPGPHVIRAVATDAFGASGEDAIAVELLNRPPSVTITTPDDGATLPADQLFMLRALASDPDVETPRLRWEGPVEVQILCSLGLPSCIIKLDEGSYVIRAVATDHFGVTATDEIQITIAAGGGGEPVAVIGDVSCPGLPSNCTSAPGGTQITFFGSGLTSTGGPLPDASLEWFSDNDGFLGTGPSLTTTLSTPSSEGLRRHIITLRVTDGAEVATDSIEFQSGSVE